MLASTVPRVPFGLSSPFSLVILTTREPFGIAPDACLVAFCSSSVVQTVFQFLGAEKSVWGGNAGGQREIAFWNVGCAVIVLRTVQLADSRLGLAVATGC